MDSGAILGFGGQSWDSGGQSWDSWGQFWDSGAILGFPGAKFQFNVTHVDTFALLLTPQRQSIQNAIYENYGVAHPDYKQYLQFHGYSIGFIWGFCIYGVPTAAARPP